MVFPSVIYSWCPSGVKKETVLHILNYIIYPSISSSRAFFVISCILIIVLLIDTSLVKVYNFTASVTKANLQNYTFVILTSLFLIGQYVILGFARSKVKRNESNWVLPNRIHKIVSISQYLILVLLATIISEIFLTSQYETLILTIITVISYGLSAVTLGLLAQLLFSWYKSNGSRIVLVYAFSSSLFVISALFSVLFVTEITSRIPETVQAHGHNLLYSSNPGSLAFVFYNGYVISSVLSFVSIWIATASALSYYSKKIGRIRFWVIVGLPLVYFLSQFVSLFLNLFGSLLDQNPVFFGFLLSIIFSASKSVGGLLFGISFWTMAKTIKKPNIVRDYLLIATIGFILLFASDQAISLISVPYPPFGLVSVASIGLASYLILIGLYNSAISVSSDINLRKFIFSSAIKELNFLGSIGSAQMEEELERRVLNLTKRYKAEIMEETAAESSLDEDEIKKYIDEVLNEVRQKPDKG